VLTSLQHRPTAASTTTSKTQTSRSQPLPTAALQITIESINARIRRAVNARGHFPTDAAALKCVYLAIMSLDPTGRGRRRWTNRWKEALNAFDITFDGRLSAARK
jgi:transposase-like protein